MKKITKYFIEGLLFLVPVVATVYVVYIIFMKIDTFFKFNVPGLGFIVTILSIMVVGFIASNFLTRRIARLVNHIFARLPLIKMVYTSIKDLINAFVREKKSFNKPVLVTLFPGSNLQAIGFVTRENLENLGLSEHVAVYFPQSYNFARNLAVVPRNQVAPLSKDSGDIMAFIISGGITAK